MSEGFTRLKQRIRDDPADRQSGSCCALEIKLAGIMRPIRFKRKQRKRKVKMTAKRGGQRRFYKTREWVEFRYRILREFGAKCMACGALTPEDGAVMNVSHITVPISKAWDRRLGSHKHADTLRSLQQRQRRPRSDRLAESGLWRT